MERWQAEMSQQRLGVVEAKDEDEAVDAAAKKFRIPARTAQNYGEQGRPRAEWINRSPEPLAAGAEFS